MRISIATCLNIPEPDEDEQPLIEALASKGVTMTLDAWDDPEAQRNFQAADLVVIRSTWNYYLDPEGFLAWVDRLGNRLMNPPSVVHQNLHKRYLEGLTVQGIGIIPTVWISRGERADLAGIVEDAGWEGVVVKPSVSAASWNTRVYAKGATPEGQAFLETLSSERDTMVQRYMPSVAQGLEKCLCWFDGDFTHAIAKQPRFAGEAESVSAVAMTDAEVAFAERIIAPYAGDILYGRVDLIPDDDGTILLSELELVEPSLFLKHSEGVLDRFAHHIIRCAQHRKEIAR